MKISRKMLCKQMKIYFGIFSESQEKLLWWISKRKKKKNEKIACSFKIIFSSYYQEFYQKEEEMEIWNLFITMKSSPQENWSKLMLVTYTKNERVNNAEQTTEWKKEENSRRLHNFNNIEYRRRWWWCRWCSRWSERALRNEMHALTTHNNAEEDTTDNKRRNEPEWVNQIIKTQRKFHMKEFHLRFFSSSPLNDMSGASWS